MKKIRKKPEILKVENIATTRLFNVQRVDLRFSNGEERVYERLKSQHSSRGAVIVIPVLDDGRVVMIYEYAVGTENYELGLVKGKIDKGEGPKETALRELKEEVGYGAKKLEIIKELSIVPGYQASKTVVVLATGIHPVEQEEGDEPESLEVVTHPLSALDDLIFNEYLTEARSIAALYYAKVLLMK